MSSSDNRVEDRMRIGVFGNTNGNMEALRTAHRAIEIKADKIFHLGDSGGHAPFVNEVVNLLIGIS